MSNWTKLPDCRDLPVQQGRVVFVDEKPVAVFNIDGNFTAMDNRCPHRGGSLGDGELEGEIVTCPWHGWQFNCRTGRAMENGSITVPTFPVDVRPDGLFVRID